MGTAIKLPLPYLVKPSFVIFDIWALWRLALSQSARMSKITSDCFSCTQSYMAAVGVRVLIDMLLSLMQWCRRRSSVIVFLSTRCRQWSTNRRPGRWNWCGRWRVTWRRWRHWRSAQVPCCWCPVAARGGLTSGHCRCGSRCLSWLGDRVKDCVDEFYETCGKSVCQSSKWLKVVLIVSGFADNC